jgi:hypothetical protein
MSTNSLVRALIMKFHILLIESDKTILFIILPFNLVVKSATADLVLFNSVIVEAKVFVVVSKSVKVAE